MAQDAATRAAASAVTEAAPPPQAEPTAIAPSAQVALAANTPASDEGAESGDYLHRYPSTGNLAELGAYLGLLFISDNNSFRGPPSVTNGVLRLKPYSDFKKPAPEFGARVGYFPLSFLGGEVEGMISPAAVDNGGSTTVLAARVQAVLQVPTYSVVPFVNGGVGYWSTISDHSGNDTDPAFHFGAGVKVAANELFAFRLDIRDNITNKRALSPYPNNIEVTAGANVVLGRPKPAPIDPDGDGILAPHDQCPNDPGPAPSGCPIRDRDGDQILDADDQCPDQAGLAPTGCPAKDSDGDGVFDDEDQCVNQAGAAPSGCPDTDGDGVLDRDDQCPNERGIAPLGCPGDTDKDGIPDSVDKCPNEPETKNGFQDQDGCPDELPAALQRFQGVISGIEFDSGKETIRASSHTVLDQAAKILGEYPDLHVEVVGHTDDTGARDFNVDLSMRRAEAVKGYLVSQGVTANRITSRGAGPDEPLDPEKTPRARQKNRRIEFHVMTK